MKDIEQFLSFAESLKLVRKAEAEIDGKNIIDDIYTDLLPNNGIINKINLPRTTILIGRKGTGKSTIFQKSQKDIDSKKNFLSIYIDVKSLYDNSTPSLPAGVGNISDSQELVKYLMYSNIIKEIILKTKEKLKQKLEQKYIVSLLRISPLILDDVYSELDEIEESIDDVFKKMNTTLVTSYKNTIDSKVDFKNDAEVSANLKDGIGGKLALSNSESNSIKKEFDNTLVTYLDIKKCFIDNIVKIRDVTGIKYLYVYLDDFSEIDKEAQILFMDWFIAPINNLSDDFVKFKIATYPKRFYYGKLDNAKIDEISLDFFDAFYSYERKTDIIDISRMEHLALDYTKRLVETRLNVYFPDRGWIDYFDIEPGKLFSILFDVSLNTPRKIWYILSYCYESCLIHKTPITITAIENAALRYYNDIVEKYFLVNEHICKPFEDKISNEHQYDLLIKLVQRQISNKKNIKKRKNKETSHFYINSKFSHLLDNLELNNFLSTYNKVSDSSNIFSNVYSLDFGICKKYQLAYGRPGHNSLGKVSLEPWFNFNNLIIDFFNSTQVIKCEKGHEFPYSELNEFKKFKMKCPTCLDQDIVSKCETKMKFQDLKERLSPDDRDRQKDVQPITFAEFLIMDLLRLSQNSLSNRRMSEQLDISLVTIDVNLRRLMEKGMCENDIEASKELNKDIYKITPRGIRFVEKIGELIKQVKINAENK